MKKTPTRHAQGNLMTDCRKVCAALILVSAVLAPPAKAVIDADITKGIWRLKFGVSDADLNNVTWQNGDADGDGVKNINEAIAGTNPFQPGSVVKITTITVSGNDVSLTFPTVLSKQYVVQASATLSGFADLVPSVTTMGTDADVTLVAPKGSNKFFRVLVQDIDTDNDGAGDWAEVASGYNPNDATTNGSTPDASILSGGISTSNVITVSVTRSSAIQPSDPLNPPVETGSITISRSGPLRISTITVPLQKTGTAEEGTDYDGLPASVEFAKANSASQGGASEVVLKINPKYNSTRKTNVTAIVKALAGAGYTLGSSVTGGVVINPAGIANGTGLTGKYYANASINYSSGNNFGVTNPSELLLTRTDPTIDFTSPYNATTNPTGWDTPAPATTRPITTISGVYSVRWTGQVMPQYSETYSFDFRSREGGKLWVNGHLLIDNWTTQTATDRINTIALKAGVLYDIKAEYFSAGAAPEARLYWWSSSRPKQIIPMERLFPDSGAASKPTAITSSLAAIGYEGTPFVFNVTAPDVGATTTFALEANSGPLPAGLTLSTAGAITGTPTLAGHYNVVVNATNTAAATVTGSSVIDITIFPTGGVTREMLTATGSSVSQLNIPTGEPTHDTIATIDDNADYAPVNTGERLRGYIVPPKTGNYYFWLAASNAAELWISNDSQYVNKVLRASVTATTGYKTWNAQASQQSPWLSLVAGEKYYFEVLHNRGSISDDHVSVGWCQDDIGTVPAVEGAPNPTGILTSIPNGGGLKQGYPYSGAVPGFICQPYDYPPVTPPTGTLYACNMGPQGGATTSASGSASLQMNAAKTQAILHFSYQNLGSARIAYHLHTDAYTSSPALGSSVHPLGEIVFDIDDADAIEAQQTADGGYIWDFGAIGSFLNAAQIVEAIETGKIYINIHSVVYPAGEIRGNFNLIEGSQTPPDPALYAEPTPTDSNTDYANAARFLNQATFGASPAEVAEVQSVGFNQWITNQLAKPNTRTSGDVVAGATADVNGAYPSRLFTDTWWKNSITAPDQLRQRLAFALSEILVVSWANDSGPLQNNARILADYYDQLVDYCLPTAGVTDSGNFRGILKAVTLTPAMGLYLDMRANQKGDVTVGRIPNENYAREIMQLFSIGIYRMWDDGRFVLGADAGLVPTYTQPSIVGLSHLLTGWNYAQANLANGRAPTSFGPGADFLNPMVLVPAYHELSSKLLLNRVISPEATGRTPRVNISGISTGSPACTVTTSTVHGLKTGDTIIISGVTGGAFTGGLGAINNSFQATVTSAKTFTVPVACSLGAGNQGTVTGATVTQPAYPLPISPLAVGVPPVTGSQADNSGTGTGHPFDQYGLKELDLAIDNIVNHENVAPYICRQLIQRLVTSDPSPGYVYRVVQKFKNNGSGVRGDLAAVVRQILTDGEARRSSVTQTSTTFGKQREPMLRLTGTARAFPSVSYTGTYTQLTGTNANKLRIVTASPNDFSAGSTVSLNFRDNYVNPPTGQTVDPFTNPTSTSYGIGTTTAIAATHIDISGISATGTSPTTITCAQPHGFTGSKTVWFFGLSGKFSDAAINSGGKTGTVTGANTFTVPISTTHVFQIASVSIGNPCVVTTTAPHGLPAGTTTGVTLNGVIGGTFSPAINGNAHSVVNTSPTTFTVTGVNCTVVPTGYTTWRQSSNPVRVTTATPHGLANGDSVTISGVSGGNFSPTINGTYVVSEVGTSAFTLASVSSIAPSTVNTGNIVGSNTLDVTATGMVTANYSQTVGSNTMTVSTTGPQTNVVVPGTGGATIKSKVHLTVLSRTSAQGITSISTGASAVTITKAGHGLTTGNTITISGVSGGTFNPGLTAINKAHTVTVVDANTFTVPAICTVAPTAPQVAAALITGSYGTTAIDGVYEVQTNGSGNFTVTTADTPTTTRTGVVLIPKITSSYTPTTGNTIVSYATNVNHNFNPGVSTQIWVDAPVNTGIPVADAEYTVPSTTPTLGVTDEDHFKTSYLPTNLNGGTYPTLSGGNNGITIWPLVPAPTGRSGTVKINQSTFVLNSTESTLTQSPLNAPTVFNYFLPDYKFPGTLANNGLDSPEFQLSTDTNLTNLTNSLTNMFISPNGGNGNLNGLNSFNGGGGSVVMDIGAYMIAAKTANAGIPALIDEIANLLVGAPLDSNVKTTIQNFVANTTNFPYTTGSPTNLQMRDRVRAIIHLIITSSSYAVQK